MSEITFEALRAGLTRYRQDTANLVTEQDYQSIIEFIQFLEDERSTTKA